MKPQILKSKYLTFDSLSSQKIMADVKDYIRKCECPELTINLEKLNMLEAVKIAVVSSAFHNKKYPDGILRCKTQSAIIKSLVSEITTRNLEFVL